MGLGYSVNPTGLDGATRREFDTLVPTLTGMTQWGQLRELPYSVTNYFALTGTWTVAAVAHAMYRYTVMNSVLTVWIKLTGTITSAGMGTTLYIRLPETFAIQSTTGILGTVRWNDGVGGGPGMVEASTGMVPNCLQLIRDTAGTVWPTGTLDVSVVATVPVYLL